MTSLSLLFLGNVSDFSDIFTHFSDIRTLLPLLGSWFKIFSAKNAAVIKNNGMEKKKDDMKYNLGFRGNEKGVGR